MVPSTLRRHSHFEVEFTPESSLQTDQLTLRLLCPHGQPEYLRVGKRVEFASRIHIQVARMPRLTQILLLLLLLLLLPNYYCYPLSRFVPVRYVIFVLRTLRVQRWS